MKSEFPQNHYNDNLEWIHTCFRDACDMVNNGSHPNAPADAINVAAVTLALVLNLSLENIDRHLDDISSSADSQIRQSA
jgi:hypothetical protein